jgi:hypothetical protein
VVTKEYVEATQPSLAAVGPLCVDEIANAGVIELRLPAGQVQYHEDVQRCRDSETLVASDNVELQRHSPYPWSHDDENDGGQDLEQVYSVSSFPLTSSESQVSFLQSSKPDFHLQTHVL